MVLFHYTGHVPANTTELVPFHEKMKLLRGMIIEWIPFEPEECADLVKFWVEYHGFQLFPFNRNEWAYGYFIPVRIEDEIEFNIAPYELDFFAINEDDSYEHEYHVFVNVRPPKPLSTAEVTSPSIIERFKELFGGA
jgi:hypothetical protein